MSQDHISGQVSHHGHHHGHHHGFHENHWFKATLGLLWGAGLLVLSLISLTLPLSFVFVINGLTLAMTLYLGFNIYKSAWHALREKKVTGETLYSISTLTLMSVSILSLFIPGLPLMIEAAPLILGFWHLGEGIEHSLIHKINHKLDLRECLPKTMSLKDGSNQQVSSLIVGDVILIKGGDALPVDGVLHQDAMLYTTRIDGSPYLKSFKKGESVKSGMQLAAHAGSIEMKATETYQNSYLSQVAKNVDQASEEKAPVEAFANKILQYFIPGLITFATVSGVLIGMMFGSALAIQCVVSVLVSACPCVLSLITPMAVRIGMNQAAECGIQFNHGKALQASADIDVVVFDLNGTLTQGELEVADLSITNKKYLPYIALLEKHSDHPVARVIQEHLQNEVKESDLDLLKLSDIDNSHHSGIQGTINGKTFMIGNQDMLAANGIKQFDKPYHDPENGHIYVVHDTKIVGQILIEDPLRKDAVAVVQQLKALKKQVHICTGADQQTAERYAKKLGVSLSHICSNTVGAVSQEGEISKQSYIQQLKEKKFKVAMVGDAANDAEAIAYADIGIAVQSNIGDPISAGMVVQQGELLPIATAFDIAHKTKKNIYQNLLISLTYNSLITVVASGLLIALGISLNPVIGVAFMVLESAVVLSNLYRLKKEMITSTTVVNDDLYVPTQQCSPSVRVSNGLSNSVDLKDMAEESSDVFLQNKTADLTYPKI